MCTKVYLITVKSPFDGFRNLICKYLIQNFCVGVHQEDLSVIFFFGGQF